MDSVPTGGVTHPHGGHARLMAGNGCLIFYAHRHPDVDSVTNFQFTGFKRHGYFERIAT